MWSSPSFMEGVCKWTQRTTLICGLLDRMIQNLVRKNRVRYAWWLFVNWGVWQWDVFSVFWIGVLSSGMGNFASAAHETKWKVYGTEKQHYLIHVSEPLTWILIVGYQVVKNDSWKDSQGLDRNLDTRIGHKRRVIRCLLICHSARVDDNPQVAHGWREGGVKRKVQGHQAANYSDFSFNSSEVRRLSALPFSSMLHLQFCTLVAAWVSFQGFCLAKSKWDPCSFDLILCVRTLHGPGISCFHHSVITVLWQDLQHL